MKHGICKLSVIPMRAKASHESELVSELLYNDIYEIIDENEEWIKIRCCYDAYEGWIRKLQHCDISSEEFQEYLSKDKYIINKAFSVHNGKVLSFGSKIFEKTDDSILLRKVFDRQLLIDSSVLLKNVPYRWGGKSIMGIDCSAFVQLCAKVAGFKLPRDASQQVNFGTDVDTLSKAEYGDIVFFENENKKITHVGILLSNNSIIHASGKVRIDMIDDIGIYNEELEMYTHHLCRIKSLS